MAHFIRIDPDDELPVILDRLPAGASCVLVLPPHARGLNSVVGAKLLARRAEALDTRVVVVTDDHAVAAHARSAGVPVAASTDEARHLLDEDDDAVPDAQDVPTVIVPPGRDSPAPGAPGRGEDGGAHSEAVSAPRAAGSSVSPGERSAGSAAPPSGERSAGARTGRASGAAAAGAHSAPATGARAGQGGAARPPTAAGYSRTGRLPSYPGPLRFLVPGALVLIPLLLLIWLASYLLNGLLNPSATLTVRPRLLPVSSAAQVRAVLRLPNAKKTIYRVPMARVSQAEKSTVFIPVRGYQLVPDKVATGTLELANTSPKPILVPAGTTFTTKLNEVSFVTTADVTLKAAHISFGGATFGVGTVPIRAAVGGTSGNVPAKAIVNPPSALAGAVNVQNVVPTAGGTDRRVRAVDPRDQAAAVASLLGALKQEARDHIERRLNTAIDLNITAVDRSPAVVRLAADRRTATLTMSVIIHGLYVHRSDLVPAASAALQSVISTTPGADFVPSSLGWTSVWSPERPATATASWDPASAVTDTIAMVVSGQMRPRLDMNSLLRAISGRSRGDALAYLRGRSDISAADITISPPWADHLPSDPTRIRPDVRNP